MRQCTAPANKRPNPKENASMACRIFCQKICHSPEAWQRGLVMTHRLLNRNPSSASHAYSSLNSRICHKFVSTQTKLLSLCHTVQSRSNKAVTLQLSRLFTNGPKRQWNTKDMQRLGECRTPLLLLKRCVNQDVRNKFKNQSAIFYICAVGVFMVGMTYAGVPLYKLYCQSSGYGGSVRLGHDTAKVEKMKPVEERLLKIKFNADTASSMQWNFRPQQAEVMVLPGETALAFFKAKNPTDKPIIGISTYNVVPFEAAQYFNKIQCFCFEEQILNPHEEVDMPVFFYIDPDFADDPKMERIDIITLSYTFFEAKDGMHLPMPGFMANTN